MADFAKASVILRRLVATLAIAILLASGTACFDTAASEAVDGVGTGHRHRLGRVWDRAASGRGFFGSGGAADLDCPVLRMACIEPPTAAARVVEGEGPI